MKLTGRPHELLEEVTEDITIVEPHGRLDSTTASEFGD
jgi:anti-anti-sigma regulatory factor